MGKYLLRTVDFYFLKSLPLDTFLENFYQEQLRILGNFQKKKIKGDEGKLC